MPEQVTPAAPALPTRGRRDFLKALARGAGLGGLLGVTALTLRRGSFRCSAAGPCRACALFARCDLPRASQVRQALPPRSLP